MGWDERDGRDDVGGYLVFGIVAAIVVVEVAVGAAIVIGYSGPEVPLAPGGTVGGAAGRGLARGLAQRRP
jgi:hypothetical protein